jgi:uncharacterized protein YwgA
MELNFCDSRDQALIAFVVAEARKVADNSDGYVGRTAIQKLVYFLQVTGVPINYRFDIHHFGPFCENILHDMDLLMADDVVKDDSDTSKYSNYAPGESAAVLLKKHEAFLEKHGGLIREVVKSLTPLTPNFLELIATLHYVFRQQKATGADGPFRFCVIQKFKEIKKNKFTDAEIAAAYEALVEGRIIES